MSLPLLRRELRANYKMILLFLAVITLYSTVIIAMYDPKLGASLDLMAESMPELFAAFGMTNAGATMLDFVANYLYGFILIAIPMLCLVLIAVRLVARYVDQGSMAYLLATPNTRGTIVTTQLFFILLCTFFLVGYDAKTVKDTIGFDFDSAVPEFRSLRVGIHRSLSFESVFHAITQGWLVRF